MVFQPQGLLGWTIATLAIGASALLVITFCYFVFRTIC